MLSASSLQRLRLLVVLLDFSQSPAGLRLFADTLVNQLQLQLAVHLGVLRGRGQNFLGLGPALRCLADLFGKEAAGLPELDELLIIQLHVARVRLCEPIAGHLAVSQSGWCFRVRALLVETEAVHPQDQRRIVLLKAGELLAWLNWTRIVHRSGQFGFLCTLVLSRDPQQVHGPATGFCARAVETSQPGAPHDVGQVNRSDNFLLSFEGIFGFLIFLLFIWASITAVKTVGCLLVAPIPFVWHNRGVTNA